jgi:prepilin-type N-terminal cleavage/methylation domain-containing protein
MRIKRLCNAKKGFSLIEVIIALAILMIVVLGLMSSYYSYYRNMTDLRIKTTGQNLGQLQLEDLRNISFTSLEDILNSDTMFASSRYPPAYNCPNYPPAEILYKPDGTTYIQYSRLYPKEPISYENLPDWDIPPVEISPLPADFSTFSSGLASITYKDDKPWIYNSGKRDSDFVVEGLTSVPGSPILPDSIKIVPNNIDPNLNDLILEKWTFPFYKKEVIIKDLTPNEDDLSKKLYEVGVTVFWTVNGVEKSTTVKQEVGFEGQI